MTNQEKNNKIIKQTVENVNRVLLIWQESNKPWDYIEANSLFRSYFIKFIKQEYGWRHFTRNIRRFNYLPTFINNKIIKINFENDYSLTMNNDVISLNKSINEFDFLKFNNNLEKNKTTEIIPNNYEHILNIKF